jgi:hypothetical protein
MTDEATSKSQKIISQYQLLRFLRNRDLAA